VDEVIRSIPSLREGKEHFALDGAASRYKMKPKGREVLKRLVIKKLGRDPFAGDVP
jgi:hypothetical protein